jgi:multiple sugar transport system substrate-binding protein
LALASLPRLGRARTIADVSGYCLAAASEEVRAAADFLAFAVGEEGAAVLAETGAVVPSHLPTLNSDSFIQQGEPPGSVDVFVDALAGASVHPYVPGWPELVTWLHPQLEELFYAPVLDLDTRLPVLDERSREFLAPEETVEQ